MNTGAPLLADFARSGYFLMELGQNRAGSPAVDLARHHHAVGAPSLRQRSAQALRSLQGRVPDCRHHEILRPSRRRMCRNLSTRFFVVHSLKS